MRVTIKTTSVLVAALALADCAGRSPLPASATIGPAPTLVKPQKRLIPDVNVVTAVGWNDAERPVAATGTRVQAFARGLDHPRWLYVLPNGDVLVAETNGLPRPDDAKGIKGWFFAHYQGKAGGDSPSANRLVLLRDVDGDGVADTKSVFLTGLNSPFGMALVGDDFYIANSDGIVRVPYTSGATTITARPTTVLDLPGGPLNHHWTKNIVASADGQHLYVAIGSNSNVGEIGNTV